MSYILTKQIIKSIKKIVITMYNIIKLKLLNKKFTKIMTANLYRNGKITKYKFYRKT